MKRKEFIKTSSAGLAGLSLSPFLLGNLAPGISDTPNKPHYKKGFMLGTFPDRSSYSIDEQFSMLQLAGFQGVEPDSGLDREEVLAARDAHGLEIPSVVCSTHWANPVSSPDPEVREAGRKGLETSLYDAHAYGAACVLFVPGVVSEAVPYEEAYHRSQEEIKKLIPLAEELDVTIGIENVWNQFLLSPMEAARYVDELDSEKVGWYFDIGNILNYGWPQHWIRILGSRIVMIHIKEFDFAKRNQDGPYAGFNVNYLEGDNNWPEIMSALREIGYSGGYGIAEPPYRDSEMDHQQWLIEHISERMDTIFAM